MKTTEPGEYIFEVGDIVQFTEDTCFYYEDPESLFYENEDYWTPEKITDLIGWGAEFEVVEISYEGAIQYCKLKGMPDNFCVHSSDELEPVDWRLR